MRYYIKSLFYSKGKPSPEYLYIFLLIMLLIITLILRLMEMSDLSDNLILGLYGFIASWLSIIKIEKTIKFKETFKKNNDFEEGI